MPEPQSASGGLTAQLSGGKAPSVTYLINTAVFTAVFEMFVLMDTLFILIVVMLCGSMVVLIFERGIQHSGNFYLNKINIKKKQLEFDPL